VYAWVDGRIVPAGDPAIAVLDHGLTVGDGVFETLAVRDGVPFALRRHLDRLAASAGRLGLASPTEATLRSAVAEVLGAASGPVGRLRITLTGGVGPLGSGRGDAGPTLILAVGPAGTWPAAETLATAPWPRNERSALAGVKTTSYAENVVALAWARGVGAGEALFCDTRGLLSECTGSNIFAVLDGELVTPALSTGCLAGVTRGLVLAWCGGAEVEVAADALDRASEVFLTSSTRDIQPVSRVDQRTFPTPGPVTASAMATWTARAGTEVDP